MLFETSIESNNKGRNSVYLVKLKLNPSAKPQVTVFSSKICDVDGT